MTDTPNDELSEKDWERCDLLWGALAGNRGTGECDVAALVAMHESDRKNIEEICDPSGSGLATKGDFAVYLLEKKASRGVLKFDSFLRSAHESKLNIKCISLSLSAVPQHL